jgi:MFS family permease
MRLSGDDVRLVFWIAVIPAAIAIIVQLAALKEPPRPPTPAWPSLQIQPGALAHFPAPFWWALTIASLLSLARFSPAFLVLKANQIGVDAAYVPIMLVLMHVVYAAAAYPFAALADRIERRVQLAMGAVILVLAAIVLAVADVFWMAAFGAALWGLQMGITQGLLSASVADAAPEHLRGTAFGTYELAVGVAAFIANAGAGALWMFSGPRLTFGVGAAIAAATLLICSLARLRKPSDFQERGAGGGV